MCVHVYVCVCMCVRMYVCMGVDMYVHVCAICVFICVCLCVCMCTATVCAVKHWENLWYFVLFCVVCPLHAFSQVGVALITLTSC